MTRDEAEIVLRLVTAYWPVPEMGDDEIDVWARTLAGLEFEDASDVAELIASSGRDRRPGAGEFMAEYRARTARPKRWTGEPVAALDRGETRAAIGTGGWHRTCNHPGNAVACRETAMGALAECRRILTESTGPLAKTFRGIVPTEEAF